MSYRDTITISVPAGMTRNYQGECYIGPDVIEVKKDDAHKFLDLVTAKAGSNCFPRLCTINGAYMPSGFRNKYTLDPDEVRCVDVPDMPGCEAPCYAYFTTCGGCLYVDYNTNTVNTADDIEGGLAPELNPVLRVLTDDDGNAVTSICMHNPGAEPLEVVIGYYS